MSHLDKTFKNELVPEIQKDLGIKNILAVPRLEKVVINSGIGKITRESKSTDGISDTIALIAGQKPVITKAKRAISAFKVREGMPVGIKVTLRQKKMYDFVERLIKVVLPRMRDFQGLNLKSIDQNFNLTIPFKDISAFPEPGRGKKVDYNFGIEVTLVTSAKSKKEAILLFEKLGLIFKKNS